MKSRFIRESRATLSRIVEMLQDVIDTCVYKMSQINDDVFAWDISPGPKIDRKIHERKIQERKGSFLSQLYISLMCFRVCVSLPTCERFVRV